jgi:non-specific serine/threonine protein kinase
MIGTVLNNRYRLDRELGQGGMGTVYEAYDLLLDRVVAAKLLVSKSLGTEGKNRLLSEARAVAQLNHPNIVSVFDAGEAYDLPYVVMEYIHGESLHAQPPKSTEEIIKVALQICDALEEAHNHGIVHRDLKPENVIMTENGLAKLTDFGLARSLASRMSQEESLTGTVFYISPEQALGKPLDGRTDLYALGVMLYEFTAGRLPFQADDPLAVITQHIHEEPVHPSQYAPDISTYFEEIILKLLAKNPDDRFGSAAETRSALENLHENRSDWTTRKQHHNIPLDLTSFIGREKEVADVRRIISENRMLTLTGVGGTGKTRLALTAARKIVDSFADGVWLVELSTIFDTGQVLRAIATALDVREKTNKPLLETLIETIHDRFILLILDNCEHLLNACASFAGRLLTACPNLKLLATSREALGLPGEMTYHVPSLRLPDLESHSDDNELWAVESMRLFHDRAVSVKPDFNPDAAQTQAVAKICSRLDGIPLAIELAAARVRALPVEEIAKRLSDRFRLLTGGNRSAIPRQQTLQALVDWSYELLTEDEKILLRRLSVFSGGCTLDAAEYVCSDGGIKKVEILDLIARLVDKSLLNYSEENGTARYDMLETIRQYAREKLIQAGEIEFSRRKHLAYYADFTAEVAPQLWQANQKAWMDQLEEEHDNLRAGLEWSLCENCGEDLLMMGMRIAAAVSYFWLVRGHWSEAWDWMKELLEAPGSAEMKNEVKTQLLYSAGFLVKDLGDVNIAKDLFSQALKESRTMQDQRSQAFALLGMGEIALNVHSIPEAETHIDQALTIFRTLNDETGILLALADKGGTAADRQEYNKAKEYYRENIKICREIGHELGVAGSLVALGSIETYFGDREQGRVYLQEGLAIFRKSGDKSGIANVLSAMGLSELYSEDMDHSKEHYEEALKITRELRSGPGIGTALIALGEIARAQSDYAAARNYYEEAMHINEHLGQMGIVTIVAHNLGYVARQQGEFEKALEFFRRSLSLSIKRDQRRFIYFCLNGIASVLVDMGQAETAARFFGFAENMGLNGHFDLDPVDRWEVNQSLKKLDQALNKKEKAHFWAEGKAMQLEEILNIAMSEP